LFGVNAGKTRLFEQNGDVTVRVRPHIVGDEVHLLPTLEQVTADGLLGDILDSDVFGPWIWNSLDKIIPSSLKIATLRDLYPAVLTPYRPRIYAVRFTDLGGGRLGLSATAVVRVSTQRASELFQLLSSR
jgi:hypothetical protein